jgi:enediyne biosynthesis protein E4
MSNELNTSTNARSDVMNQSNQTMRRSPRWLTPLIMGAVVASVSATAEAQPVTFTDVSPNPSTGITYRRTPSDTDVLYDAFKIKPIASRVEIHAAPTKTRGTPGVAILDYDGDGDLDIYVTNGPGTANSLYQNQLVETGQATFVDVSIATGVDATDMDSTGVCYGDIDNDGDNDILVLGRMEPARLFENDGSGNFTNISIQAGIGQAFRGHTSCAMGDVDNDGLLDVFISATFDWSRLEAIWSDPFSYNHTNELWLNQGGNVFTDVSQSSGILELLHVPPGDGTITWSAALVDFDQDGDIDIIHADDQAALPPAAFAGVNRGIVHILVNDGTGHFTDVTASQGIDLGSSWMGLSLGDVNCDGHLDYFVTTLGDYAMQQMGIPLPPPNNTSQWFLGSASGKFSMPTVGPLVATPFGWGTGMADFDNDADTDIVYYGSIDLAPMITADNPGVVFTNQGCSGHFEWDQAATASSAPNVLRNTVEGVATGDLDGDGFTDVVWVSSSYIPAPIPLVPTVWKWGGPFDQTAFTIPTFLPIGPFEWEWAGVEVDNGYLGIEMNSGNGNGWAKVEVLGAKGLTPLGMNNRSGIGAIVKFRPENKPQVMAPVLGGSSFTSQHSLVQGFGMGDAAKGVVTVQWPGGVKNRLYDVLPGETVLMPEIPCDFAGNWVNKKQYKKCVNDALKDLKNAGVITNAEVARLRESALDAFGDNP